MESERDAGDIGVMGGVSSCVENTGSVRYSTGMSVNESETNTSPL